MKKTLLATCALALAAFAPPRPAADDLKATDLLPSTTVFYAEMAEPKKFLATVLDHPLRAKIESLDLVKAALDNDQFREFQNGVEQIETQIGMPWRKALEEAAGGGISFAFDGGTQSLALLVKAGDAAILEKLRDTVLAIAQGALESADYRGVTAYKIGEGGFAVVGPWLIVVQKGPLGKKIIDAHLDKGGETLSKHPRFKEGRAAIAGSPTAWAWLDVETLRQFNVPENAYKGITDNFALELLAGGLLNHVQKIPYAVASLAVQTKGVKLTVSAPHDDAWTAGPREYFFGAGGKGTAPALLKPKETVLSVSAYRDVGGLWAKADELFDPSVVEGMTQAESTLATLFSGKDFGDDILGAIEPQIQIVARRQSFEAGAPQPAIKIPAFALVVRMKDPAETPGEFRRTFKSLIGFLNIQGAMEGQPQLDLEDETHGDVKITTATYAPPKGQKDIQDGPLNYNFSPSIAFAGSRLILASTKQIARELAALPGDAQTGTHGAANTRAELDAGVLRAILDDNRASLVAQNQLGEGTSAEEAKARTDALLQVVGAFRGASLKLATQNKLLSIELEVNLGEGK
jgi:hypothetical protein